MTGTVSYVLNKNAQASAMTGIVSTTYDDSTGIMTTTTVDGKTFDVSINNGVTPQNRKVLNATEYDEATKELKVNGNNVLTENEVEDSPIDFDL